MPSRKSGRRRLPVLRGLGFLVAAALGVVGVWFIVVGDSSKDVRIGVIAAFWGLLLGTFAVFGARVPGSAAAHPVAPPVPAPPVLAPVPAPPASPPSRELDLRQIGEIERSAVAAARREFQEELQMMLRREVGEGFVRELASLRAEVNALRSDLVEKVGGQLRLERIETTRLIGSDLEAVQSELRKLRETGLDGEDGAGAALPPVIPVASPGAEVHDAEIVSEQPSSPAPAGGQAADVTADVTAHVNGDADAHVNGDEPVGEAPSAADPFANMPRIRPFTDFELDPVPSAPEQSEGRHSRRHRADEGGSDVLARILAREQR